MWESKAECTFMSVFDGVMLCCSSQSGKDSLAEHASELCSCSRLTPDDRHSDHDDHGDHDGEMGIVLSISSLDFGMPQLSVSFWVRHRRSDIPERLACLLRESMISG
jgi:hypothetical protein